MIDFGKRFNTFLKKKKIELIDPSRFHLRCLQCGDWWSPKIPPAGKKMARGYWKCINGCNHVGS